MSDLQGQPVGTQVALFVGDGQTLDELETQLDAARRALQDAEEFAAAAKRNVDRLQRAKGRICEQIDRLMMRGNQ